MKCRDFDRKLHRFIFQSRNKLVRTSTACALYHHTHKIEVAQRLLCLDVYKYHRITAFVIVIGIVK